MPELLSKYKNYFEEEEEISPFGIVNYDTVCEHYNNNKKLKTTTKDTLIDLINKEAIDKKMTAEELLEEQKVKQTLLQQEKQKLAPLQKETEEQLKSDFTKVLEELEKVQTEKEELQKVQREKEELEKLLKLQQREGLQSPRGIPRASSLAMRRGIPRKVVFPPGIPGISGGKKK